MSDLFGIALVNDPHALGLKLHPESLNNKVRTQFLLLLLLQMLLLHIYFQIKFNLPA